jgi:RNA polymerase primary sigma factor
VLADLAAELRFAPREALLRDLGRAEALAGEVEPETAYPLDWVVFRVTGYRPDVKETPLVSGAELLGDLSALVERLSDAAGLKEEELGGPSEGADELAARWNVSRKTLDRWRRQGLIARRVQDGRGGARLRVMAAAAEAFAARHGTLIERAAGFSRIDRETESRIVRRARRYHDLLGCSLNQAADRLAVKFGRSREAVRQLLLRHDAETARRGETPTFDERGALPERTQRAIERAWRRGIEPGEMVRRYHRTRGGIHRIVNEQRLRRLRGLDLGRTAPGAAGLDDGALRELLAADPAQTLDPQPAPVELVELLGLMRARVVPIGVEERARARAEHALRARAGRTIAAISGGFPEAGLLDRAETDLRWAAALRAALARTQLRLVVETLESSLSVELDRMRAQDARAAIKAGLDALRLGMDAYDPWKAGRLAAPVGFAVAKVRLMASAESQPGERRRAQVRLLSGSPAPDWTRLVSPWAGALRPDGRLAGARSLVEPELARVLTERFGMDGARPRTLAEIAAERRITIMQAGRLERRAVRAALTAARGVSG